MKFSHRYKDVRRAVGRYMFRHTAMAPLCHAKVESKNILVLGVYLTEFPNQAHHLVQEYARSRLHRVEQRWAAVGRGAPAPDLHPVTTLHTATPIPKFSLLNELLRGLNVSTYDYVIVSDDDIRLPRRFIDGYVGLVSHLDLAIAQPARTRFSYADHAFVKQHRRFAARLTHFVEIGPVFSLNRAASSVLLPFDLRSPMGWGYDLAWPAVAIERHWRMGIIDAIPVDHSYRPQASAYDHAEHRALMENYLGQVPHLTKPQAQRVLERVPRTVLY